MAADRKIIEYLPHYMQEYAEMKAIMDAEQPEVDALWDAADGAFSDQYIQEATENGVKRWESMLGISPKGTDTLEERRFRILSQQNQELPYTLRKLQQMLTNLCGADGYSIEVTASEYRIQVKLALTSRGSYGEVEKILKKMIPANMVQSVQIMYNANEVLTAYTHAQLAAYTHNQLKSEVFE